MDSRPIGLFDSGVGGLSILAEIKKALPRESFVFLADQAHNPYGSKTRSELKKLAEKITKFLIKYDIKIVVVACNTASCYAIDHLRNKFTVPIIGVVPAIKPALTLAKSGKIVVMSTPATAKSSYLKNLIKELAADAKVMRLGCDGLEEAVEYLKFKDITRLLATYLEKVRIFGADVIVLGCTHYPFLKNDIVKIVGQNIQIVDSGYAIATRVTAILKQGKMFSSQRSQDFFLTTGDPQKFSKVASTLLKYKISCQKALI